MRLIDIDRLTPYRLNEHYKFRLVYDADEVAHAPTIIDRPKGECRTCARNADNGGYYEPEHRTRCPIQEHYALLQDGYCHLYEQI